MLRETIQLLDATVGYSLGGHSLLGITGPQSLVMAGNGIHLAGWAAEGESEKDIH